MDNYLSYRWPKGPGLQPPPVPDPAAVRSAPRPEVRRAPRRWIVPTVCVVLALVLLGGISFWAVNGLANLLDNAEFPENSGDPPVHPTWPISGGSSDWTLDDLPWGEPDPSVQLSVAAGTGAVLSGRDIHEKVLPSIVYVRAAEKGTRRQSYYSGTGIIVTASGYVLTNFHIIEETDSVQVRLLTGQTTTYYDAQVIGVDEEFDLAVLKFDGEGLNLTPARLGDSDQLAVGDNVYAEGNPMGYLLGSMSSGIVSALGRDTEVDSALGFIQIDVPLNPGNSGGALVNDHGQVVGITSAKITGLVRDDGDSYEDAAVIENIGLAIPISDALPFINRILATGKSWRPSIGIKCKEAELDGRRGILVDTVEAGTPALEAGLRKDDLIVSANGRQVTDLITLRRVIYRSGADSQLHCIVVREGEELPITFALIDKLGQE